MPLLFYKNGDLFALPNASLYIPMGGGNFKRSFIDFRRGSKGSRGRGVEGFRGQGADFCGDKRFNSLLENRGISEV